MNIDSLETIEWVAGGGAEALPSASVIVLHGLGADGNDFVPVARAMDLSAVGPVRWIFPNAPVRPVTLNAGVAMRAWYDIHPPGADGHRPEDEIGLRASQRLVQGLIDQELQRGMASQRVVLMGFSQGCAMTLMAGLRAPQRLAALVALSGYLPLAGKTAAERSDANRETPVFMAHGDFDGVVVPSRGEASRDALVALGQPVHWHAYPMAHEVCMPEIADLNAWLVRQLS